MIHTVIDVSAWDLERYSHRATNLLLAVRRLSERVFKSPVGLLQTLTRSIYPYQEISLNICIAIMLDYEERELFKVVDFVAENSTPG